MIRAGFSFGVLLVGLAGCMPLNAYLYVAPDHKDLQRFAGEYKEVDHAASCYEFKRPVHDKAIYITNWDPRRPLEQQSLSDFLKGHRANQFLVIKNDSLVFEYQKDASKALVPASAFSITKTFVSAALGCAISQGYIGSVDDLVKDYIPELNYHDYFNKLTIAHLLNQKSGIKSTVPNIADAYYGKIEKVLTRLKFVAKPGERLEYVNINSALVGVIIERATKKHLYEYFSDNIWTKIGTCDSSVWAYDGKTNHTRALSGFAGSARDYAKFGKLYLDNGQWNGQQVIDSNWVRISTTVTNSLGDKVGYNNNWFIGEEMVGDYTALGMYRQHIYVNPKKKVVIVSLLQFRHKNLDLKWWQIMRQISEQL